MTATTATPAQIAEALITAKGNKAQAAKALDTNPRTFGRWLDTNREEIEVLIAEQTAETEARDDTPEDVSEFMAETGATREQAEQAIDAAAEQAEQEDAETGATMRSVSPDGSLVVIMETRHIDITAPAADVAPVEDEPAETVKPAKVRKARPTQSTGAAQAVKAAPEFFPEGVVTPVQFRHHLVREGLAPESLSTQVVYNWVKSPKFTAVRHYAADGTIHDAPSAGTIPGVTVTEGVAWYTVKLASKAAK